MCHLATRDILDDDAISLDKAAVIPCNLSLLEDRPDGCGPPLLENQKD